LTDLLALLTIMVWPVVPLFWIPVHGFSRFFKNLGLATYLLPILTWVPVAYLIYANRAFLMQFRIVLPTAVIIAGILFLLAGTLLHIWTGTLLGLWGLMGLPEISSKIKGRLVTEGPFSVVRHPTYLAHTLMFLGVFLITGVIAVAVITFVDFLLINILIIPLEDRELLRRFGDEYKRYMERVAGFIPRITH
jgi:protein-S-isoprenylcysteine O-methyltransferase Ste14